MPLEEEKHYRSKYKGGEQFRIKLMPRFFESEKVSWELTYLQLSSMKTYCASNANKTNLFINLRFKER